jgi:chromosomal replication initiation ATPase DnaA
VSASAQFSFPLPLATAYSARDFAVSACNRLAYERVTGWPQGWGAPVLVLQGPAAAGKTHLATIWAVQSGARFIPPQHLTADAVRAIISDGEAAQAWVLDGLEQLADETALFHLLNAVREQEGALLITTQTAPAQMRIGLADLRSRLCAAPLVALEVPDDVALAAVVVKQFADRQLRVSDDVVQYLLRRMDRSFASARHWVARIDEEALARQSKVSVALVRQLLEADTGTGDMFPR